MTWKKGIGQSRLCEVCMMGALEMQSGEYVKYTYNNMVIARNNNSNNIFI
jgi:hypothetical protein